MYVYLYCYIFVCMLSYKRQYKIVFIQKIYNTLIKLKKNYCYCQYSLMLNYFLHGYPICKNSGLIRCAHVYSAISHY